VSPLLALNLSFVVIVVRALVFVAAVVAVALIYHYDWLFRQCAQCIVMSLQCRRPCVLTKNIMCPLISNSCTTASFVHHAL
jgi:hypothetical protein